MGNKRKNSNYITKKSIEREKQRYISERRRKRRKTLCIVLYAILSAILVAGIVLALGFGVFGWGRQKFEVTHHATIEIEDYGTVHVELYGKEAPITVANFVELANSGFYNGLTFHRIVDGFVVQGGKSDSATLSPIKGEFNDNGVDNDITHKRGVISMARTGQYDSATSQFFIVQKTSAENTKTLDGAYAAFGKVTSGMDVVDKICKDADPIDDNGSILPSKQPKIKSITIHASH